MTKLARILWFYHGARGHIAATITATGIHCGIVYQAIGAERVQLADDSWSAFVRCFGYQEAKQGLIEFGKAFSRH